MATENLNAEDLKIPVLGRATLESPLNADLETAGCAHHFRDEERIVFDLSAAARPSGQAPASVEVAGPRRKIFFDPAKTSAAIVTCGGLCPGLNDVIRGLVMTLTTRYGIQRIFGIRYGYEGFIPRYGHEPLMLTPEVVDDIHELGGTILGVSRGQQNSEEIVDYLAKNKIDLLFTIGGDGTQRGAFEIAEIARGRGLKISIVGVPKTIDNDILLIDQSFGFATAVAIACESVLTAHAEAKAQRNGIGLVKLMGRHSGFITCWAALATPEANFVLIPEVPFDLDGERGFLQALKRRLERRHHAVILVAEGAGQELFQGAPAGRDASGNLRLKDIGVFLKERIQTYFDGPGRMGVNLKYMDPSYLLRAVKANPTDSVYCWRLAQNAVHAAMSGRTQVVVGMRHHQYVHLPMKLIAQGRRQVDPHSDVWLSVLEATGQPPAMLNQMRMGAVC